MFDRWIAWCSATCLNIWWTQATVLRQLLPWLKEDGQLLTCIPNVQHWSVIANLLNGQWPQEDQGLFDRTHLRWFTKAEHRQLMENLGLRDTRHHTENLCSRSSQSICFSIETSTQNNEHQCPNGAGRRSSIAICSSRRKNKTKISPQISGLMLKPQAGMNDVRMIQPLRSISSTPALQVQLSSESLNIDANKFEAAKIMIWQRQLLTYDDSLEKIRSVIKSGYVLISEFDDDPDHWPLIKENKHLNFTGVHAVQVSTPTSLSKN